MRKNSRLSSRADRKQKLPIFVTASRHAANKEPQFFDRDEDIERQLREVAPDIVIDATGPFQNYGADPYRIVTACPNLGVHYVDFGDGADRTGNST